MSPSILKLAGYCSSVLESEGLPNLAKSVYPEGK